MIWSVSMLSPTTYAGPLKTDFMVSIWLLAPPFSMRLYQVTGLGLLVGLGEGTVHVPGV
jgi:hypothetical protein